MQKKYFKCIFQRVNNLITSYMGDVLYIPFFAPVNQIYYQPMHTHTYEYIYIYVMLLVLECLRHIICDVFIVASAYTQHQRIIEYMAG